MFSQIFSFEVLFYYFYTKMLCAGCGSSHCPTKSNTAEQNLLIFTISAPHC